MEDGLRVKIAIKSGQKVSLFHAPKKLLPETAITEARKELFEIREGILRLMDEYRGRPGRNV